MRLFFTITGKKYNYDMQDLIQPNYQTIFDIISLLFQDTLLQSV